MYEEAGITFDGKQINFAQRHLLALNRHSHLKIFCQFAWVQYVKVLLYLLSAKSGGVASIERK